MDDTNNLINFLMPSNDRPDSLYKQLSKSLNRAIQQGLLTPGDALMPERELASRLNMSRITVRKAIDQLVEIGLLEKKRCQVSNQVTTRFESSMNEAPRVSQERPRFNLFQQS